MHACVHVRMVTEPFIVDVHNVMSYVHSDDHYAHYNGHCAWPDGNHATMQLYNYACCSRKVEGDMAKKKVADLAETFPVTKNGTMHMDSNLYLCACIYVRMCVCVCVCL